MNFVFDIIMQVTNFKAAIGFTVFPYIFQTILCCAGIDQVFLRRGLFAFNQIFYMKLFNL